MRQWDQCCKYNVQLTMRPIHLSHHQQTQQKNHTTNQLALSQNIHRKDKRSPLNAIDKLQSRTLSDNSRTKRLYTMPERSKAQKRQAQTLINQSEFMKHQALVQYYSNNVFTQSFKFKRFTGILKKKFKHFPQNTPNIKKQQRNSQFWKESLASQQQNRCSRSMDREVFQNLQPKLTLKRRPSSGIPMKKGEMVIKRRKSSFNECSRSCSIDIKHIDALKCTQRSHSPRTRIKDHASPTHCLCLKSINKTPQLQVKSRHYESIDPWENDIQKLRMLTDMDISVKI